MSSPPHAVTRRRNAQITSILTITSPANGSMAVLIAAKPARAAATRAPASRTSSRSARTDAACRTCSIAVAGAAPSLAERRAEQQPGKTTDTTASGQDADTCSPGPPLDAACKEPVQRGYQGGGPGLHVGQAKQLRQSDPRRGSHRRRLSGGGVMRRPPIQPRAQSGQCHRRHRIGVVIGGQDTPDGGQVVRVQLQGPAIAPQLESRASAAATSALCNAVGGLTDHRPVDIERAQRSPGPGQGSFDRREMAPDQVDHLDAQHLADIREDRRGLACRGGFGDGGNRVGHPTSVLPGAHGRDCGVLICCSLMAT